MQWGASVYAHPRECADVCGLSVLADPRGTLTIDEISQPARTRDFIPAPHGFSAGYTRTVHWLRFELAAPAPAQDGSRRLLVEFYPPYLDDLQIFIPRADGSGFDRFLHGDRRPFSTRVIPYRSFVQPVDFKNDSPIEVYVRLQTTSSSMIAIDARTPAQFMAKATTEYAWLGLFFGVLVVALLVNLRYAFNGDPLQRAFLIHLATALYMLLSIHGLFAEYVFRNSAFWADRSVSIGAMLVVSSNTYFYGKALQIDQASRWLHRLYRVVFWLGILSVPAVFLDAYPETQRVLIGGAALVLLTGLWRSVQLFERKAWGSAFIMVALLCSLLGASATTLTLLGLLPGQFWLINSYTISTLGTLLALQAYFMLQGQLNKARLIEAQMDAVRASSVLEAERAAKEAQSRFLAMLTHELRAPLSALRLCLAGLPKAGNLRNYAETAVVQIDTVIERCDLASRFDDGRLEVVKTRCGLDELVSDMLVQRQHGERIALDTDYDPSIVMQSDPALLRTILDNLTGNALKYSPPDTSVRLTANRQTRNTQSGVRIRVENQVAGPSMRPDPERVFSKYYRAPHAQRSTGSGLGLYIARGMSAMLGGDIRYISDQPTVIFEVWIPA